MMRMTLGIGAAKFRGQEDSEMIVEERNVDRQVHFDALAVTH